MRKSSLLGILFFLFCNCIAQKQDSTFRKTGWTFGALPTITYSSDLGLQYGALVNLFEYGNGETYPKYNHSVYFEVSRFTKGSGINRFFYDSDKLIPGWRVTYDLSYLTEQALSFYGFNGNKSVFNKDWIDEDNKNYKSKFFYAHERKMLRTKLDLQKSIVNTNWRYLLGFEFYQIKLNNPDLSKLTDNETERNKLEKAGNLYNKYAEWRIIEENEINGGNITVLKAGLVYDSRPYFSNPHKGIWSEIALSYSPSDILESEQSFTTLSLIHRQYYLIIPKGLNFAYRLGIQKDIAGKRPFYMLPILFTTYMDAASYEGIGSSKTVRGILRNRVVGRALTYGNMEFRYQFKGRLIWKQNIKLALNVFLDWGKIIEDYDYNLKAFPNTVESREDYFSTEKDPIHISYGGGVRFILNENFVVACDYGLATLKQDGDSRIYIGLNYLF